jgi:hypothetical protein
MKYISVEDALIRWRRAGLDLSRVRLEGHLDEVGLHHKNGTCDVYDEDAEFVDAALADVEVARCCASTTLELLGMAFTARDDAFLDTMVELACAEPALEDFESVVGGESSARRHCAASRALELARRHLEVRMNALAVLDLEGLQGWGEALEARLQAAEVAMHVALSGHEEEVAEELSKGRRTTLARVPPSMWTPSGGTHVEGLKALLVRVAGVHGCLLVSAELAEEVGAVGVSVMGLSMGVVETAARLADDDPDAELSAVLEVALALEG